MRGEPLVEYAAVLRTIVGDRNIGEEVLIDAFLNGMGSQDSRTYAVGSQRPWTRRCV
jgi:DNA-directed RNA polymerase specialized sigma24 family protein